MNNAQLYLPIGIPSLLVILNMVQANHRLSDKLDRVVEQLSAKIDKIAEQQHKDSLQLMSYMVPLHERMAKLESSR